MKHKSVASIISLESGFKLTSSLDSIVSQRSKFRCFQIEFMRILWGIKWALAVTPLWFGSSFNRWESSAQHIKFYSDNALWISIKMPSIQNQSQIFETNRHEYALLNSHQFLCEIDNENRITYQTVSII